MQFVISIRRAFRDQAPQDWPDRVRRLDGVTAATDPLFGRMTVEAAPDVQDRLEQMLGERFIVEPVIGHSTSDDDRGAPD